MNKLRRNLVGGASSLFATLYLLTPSLGHALLGIDLTGGMFTLIQYIGYGISYIISVIALFVFSIEAFALQLAIDLNRDIVSNAAVQMSFSIVLAFANILFVAAVIIMAVATIVRYDAYGAKQMLWKIVIAAIGVNFSLILAGTVMTFSDEVTGFFLNHAVPTPGAAQGVSAVAPGRWFTGGFVDNLAGAFNPQSLYNVETNAEKLKDQVTTTTIVAPAANKTTTDLGAMSAALLGVYMTAGMAVVMAIFMGVLVGAFFMRFIMLGLLLTLMPAVWVAWLFPFGKPLVNWWKNLFIKWTFFAPMVMFFLYLAMKTLEVYRQMHQLTADSIQGTFNGQKGTNGIADFINQSLRAFAAPLVSNIIKFSLVAGTLWGGLFLASKFGIKAAGVGAKAMETFGNSVKRRTVDRAANYAKTQATNIAGRTTNRLRTAGALGNDKGLSYMQRAGNSLATLGQRSKVAKYTGVGALGRAVGKPLASAGTSDKAGRDERVKGYKEEFKNLGADTLQTELERIRMGRVSNPDKEQALFELLKDKKELGGVGKRLTKKADDEYNAWLKTAPGIMADEKERKRYRADVDSKYEKEQKANTEKLSLQLKRASDGGYLKDILAANPQLAEFAPLKKTKGANPRTMTKTEAVADAIASVKNDDIASIAFDPKLFGNTEAGKAPDAKHILNVNALSNEQIKKIGDLNLDAAIAIRNTLQAIHDFGKDPFDSTGAIKAGGVGDHFVKTHNADGSAIPDVEIDPDKLGLASAIAKAKAKLKNLEKNVNLSVRIEDAEAAATPPAPAVTPGESLTSL